MISALFYQSLGRNSKNYGAARAQGDSSNYVVRYKVRVIIVCEWNLQAEFIRPGLEHSPEELGRVRCSKSQ